MIIVNERDLFASILERAYGRGVPVDVVDLVGLVVVLSHDGAADAAGRADLAETVRIVLIGFAHQIEHGRAMQELVRELGAEQQAILVARDRGGEAVDELEIVLGYGHASVHVVVVAIDAHLLHAEVFQATSKDEIEEVHEIGRRGHDLARAANCDLHVRLIVLGLTPNLSWLNENQGFKLS